VDGQVVAVEARSAVEQPSAGDRGGLPAADEASRWRGVAGRAWVFLAVLFGLVALWEGYRAFGVATHLTWPFPVNDNTMPHVYDMFAQLFKPSRRNGPLLIHVLGTAALYTARSAFVGFVMGAVAGFALGVLFAHSRLLERGLLPFVVASQTVPILAIAPMVVIWLKAGWFSVAVIASYLTFFPVTINTLRGLRSADPRAHDLMRTYAAGRWDVLWKLRVPSALPFLFTALKVSATASVVGAIIAEPPASIQDGLGGAIVNFNQYYLTSPESLWATIIVAALVGILFFGVVVMGEHLFVHRAPGRAR
jgi:NitT/TauT family transport system permease protein